MTPHKFPIGTTYTTRGKSPKLCTVTSQLTTTDHTGKVIRRYYHSTHQFMGQTITDHDACETTIALGLVSTPPA